MDRRIFTRNLDFTFEHNGPQDLWVPGQLGPRDFFSCGLRVYDTMKTMLLRLNEAYNNDITDNVRTLLIFFVIYHHSTFVYGGSLAALAPGPDHNGASHEDIPS